MAFKIYRNNRIVPPLIGLVTIFLLWCLIDPTAQQPQRRVQVGNTASSSTSSSNNPAAVNQESKQKEGAAPQQPPTKAAHGESTLLHDTDAASAPGHQRLHSDEVLLILKTGATVLWRRLPIHLTTTLSPERIAPENVALYAEVDAKIGNWTVLDILKDAPPALQASDPFELYRSLRDWDETNAYLEQTGLPGDDEGPPGGWRLDKYKFLPLMQHAGQHWPQVKWYLYTEDDTYLFLPNVLWYLSSYDARESHWLGGLGEKLGTTFAHGGSGFALSRGAWEQSFGQAQAAAAATAATTSTSTSGGREDGHGLVTKYQSFVDEACCGDYALGKVLNDYGVRFGEDHGETVQFWGFNGLPHWKMEFSRDNWCVPVLTWHHAHSRDIARYYELERSWDFQLVIIFSLPTLKNQNETIPRYLELVCTDKFTRNLSTTATFTPT